MKPQIAMIAACMTLAITGTVSAQTTSPTTSSNAGAYDALPEGNRKIVSSIYESQFGSPNDSAGGTLLTRDDIAAMKQDTGWGNAYRQLYEQGMVSERNLGQAISSQNHSLRSTTASGGSVTVVTTAGGEQTTVARGKSGNSAASSSAKTPGGQGAAMKADHGKSATVTNAGGGSNAVVTTAGGGNAGANAAAAQSSAGGVSRAGGNGNGNAFGKTK